MSGLLFIISLALLVACSSAFMYLPPHETSWGNAQSSLPGLREQSRAKREQMESMFGPQQEGPADLAAVYNYPFNQNGGWGLTVAVTIYGNCTYAESDLAAYNQRYGLPACTFANGCLTKITSNGDHNWPVDNSQWDAECSLDVQQIHGTAPGAKILIVTSGGVDSNSMYQTLKYAGQHANYVSASWGSNEGFSPIEDDLANAISVYGTSFFASSGDAGGQAVQLYPASSAYVVAVGGTSIQGSGMGATEFAWIGSGGGCSTVYSATAAQLADPGYQRMGCNGKRGVPDLAYDADPNLSGIQTYVHGSGWASYGGTSASAPRAAARAAVNRIQITPHMLYGGAMQYRDVTQGGNGAHQAGTGYDLVTGKGSWINLVPGNYPTPRPINPPPPASNPGGPEGC